MNKMKCKYKIIDNVLSNSVADEIINHFIGNAMFPWYYNHTVVPNDNPNDLYNYQLTHTFYNQYAVCSSFFPIISPLVQYLNPESIIKIKANLNPRTEVRHTFDYHTDFNSKSDDRKTAIYYVNSNDGVTILADGTEIESIANRLVIFDQKISHTGTTCTDQKVRCVINLNYIEHCDD
jgi:hypothetical protein